MYYLNQLVKWSNNLEKVLIQADTVRYVKRENVGHTNNTEDHILKCSDTEKDFRKSIYHKSPMQSMG